MALSELEIKRYAKIMDGIIEKRRPPAHILDKLDISYRIYGKSIEIFEIRPVWNNPAEKIQSPIAKATYVKSSDTWKIYWMRADLKWHGYEPVPSVKTLAEFLKIVDEVRVHDRLHAEILVPDRRRNGKARILCPADDPHVGPIPFVEDGFQPLFQSIQVGELNVY